MDRIPADTLSVAFDLGENTLPALLFNLFISLAHIVANYGNESQTFPHVLQRKQAAQTLIHESVNFNSAARSGY